jgi:hypothetical protein
MWYTEIKPLNNQNDNSKECVLHVPYENKFS